MKTRRKKPKHEPKTTAHILKTAADLFSEALFLIDRSHRIILANNAAQKMTALPETLLISQQIETILSLENPKAKTKPGRIKLPSDSLLFLPAKVHAVSYSATFLPLDYIPYFAAFRPRPIALVIATPEASTQFQDHTNTTIFSQILGQLTMRVAHDFSNSLTSIIGNAELIEEQIAELVAPPIPERLQSLADNGLPELQDVIRKSREMAQFINTLQEYARQYPTTTQTLDLNTAIKETIGMAKSLLGRKIQIEFLPSEQLPTISMDRLRIDQILLSILVNCKTKMPSGGRITIETEEATLDAEFVASHPGSREGIYTRLSITDSSAGMDPETLKHIFDFPKSTKSPDPSNLSLPTAYAILKNFRGYIDVESWIGKGTRFDIYIPPTPPGPTHAQISDEEEILYLPLKPFIQPLPAIAQTTTPINSTILIAEDDTEVSKMMERHLARADYKTIITSDGNTALDLYRKLSSEGNQPTLLIADLGLPGIDGRTLSTTIRNEYPSALILLTSGYRIELKGPNQKTEDGFDFLQKPFGPNSLISTIQRILTKTT
jgi:signal transduction histidine kinase/CheY-like chemotaxis protein